MTQKSWRSSAGASGYRCPECNKGRTELVAMPGRRMRWRQVSDLEIPAQIEIPTCQKCGAEFIDRRTADKLDSAMAKVYRSMLAANAERAIAGLAKVITQRDLERLLGLSAGYLSKIRGGKETTAPLVAALMLLAEDPTRIEELKGLWAA